MPELLGDGAGHRKGGHGDEEPSEHGEASLEEEKVHEIKNQDGVSENDLGHEVKVSGHLYKDGSVHVMKVAPAS